MARFLSIKQDGSLEDYRQKFEMYSAPLPGLSEEVMENTFLNGLIPELRAEVISRRPEGLDEILLEAQLVDDRNYAIRLAVEEMTGGKPSKAAAQHGTQNGPNKSGIRNRQTIRRCGTVPISKGRNTHL